MISRQSVVTHFPVKKLGDTVEFLDSLRRPVTESDRKEGPYPYYGANGQQGTIADFIFDEPLVLLAEDGGHFESPDRGIAYRISGKTWVNNHAHVLRPKPDLNLAYLCRVLENYDVTPFVTGSTRGKLTKGGASEIPIPLPSLPEQCRIAAILDKADALRAKRREALAQLDRLAQSIFVEMFGDPLSNPKNWRRVRLGDLMKSGPQNGLYKPASEYGSGTPILRIDAFYDGVVTSLSNLKRLRATDGELALYGLRVGDIVINRVNSPEYLGKSALIPALSEPVVFESNMMRFALKDEVLPEYAIAFLQTDFIKSQIRVASKDAVNQSSINQQDVKGFTINVPSISLQNRFSSVLAEIGRQRSLHIAAISQTQQLFASLQHRAFRGEL